MSTGHSRVQKPLRLHHFSTCTSLIWKESYPARRSHDAFHDMQTKLSLSAQQPTRCQPPDKYDNHPIYPEWAMEIATKNLKKKPNPLGFKAILKSLHILPQTWTFSDAQLFRLKYVPQVIFQNSRQKFQRFLIEAWVAYTGCFFLTTTKKYLLLSNKVPSPFTIE